MTSLYFVSCYFFAFCFVLLLCILFLLPLCTLHFVTSLHFVSFFLPLCTLYFVTSSHFVSCYLFALCFLLPYSYFLANLSTDYDFILRSCHLRKGNLLSVWFLCCSVSWKENILCRNFSSASSIKESLKTEQRRSVWFTWSEKKRGDQWGSGHHGCSKHHIQWNKHPVSTTSLFIRFAVKIATFYNGRPALRWTLSPSLSCSSVSYCCCDHESRHTLPYIYVTRTSLFCLHVFANYQSSRPQTSECEVCKTSDSSHLEFLDYSFWNSLYFSICLKCRYSFLVFCQIQFQISRSEIHMPLTVWTYNGTGMLYSLIHS